MDFLSRTIISVLSAGPVPQHIAFIMDGNRRYARNKNQPVQEGHSEGFVNLKRMLEACLRLGVKCVSVYAFAIDNFKRSEDEVGALMSLATDKIQELCGQGELLEEYGVRLNILGKKSLLPANLQKIIANAEKQTKHHDRAILNICMPYASRDEITTAIQSTIRLHHEGELSLEDITESEIESHLSTSLVGSPPLDMLIRTSGVKRLSDYLLWQASDKTQIYFSEAYWPDFGLREFVPILLNYQRKAWQGP